MPTVISHPAVPLALGLGLGRANISGRLLAAGVIASTVPDLDVLAFRLGIPYSAQLGHRGFSHSLAVALLVALLGAASHRWLGTRPWTALWFLFVAIASHGLLDAFTNGGLGVAFFWPFSDQRFFAPLRVIEVAPFSPARLFSARKVSVLVSELRWIWIPSMLLGAALAWARKSRCRDRSS